MAGASPSPLSPGTVGMVQWTLVGIQVLVLACVVAWLGRDSRLGRIVRRIVRRQGRRATLSGISPESTVALGGARPTRLVSAAGGGVTPVRLEASPGPREASRTPRPLRLARTPARGVAAVGRTGQAPTALHCPGCGALLVRGEVAARLVTRCAGCERRVAVRVDGERVVVTLEP